MKITSRIPEMQKALSNIEKDHISESAAQCAYYTILSSIPFTILVLTLIQYTGIEAQQFFNILSDFVPNSMKDLILNVVMEVYSKSLGTLSISLIFTLFAANKGLYALIKGLHLIYNYSDNKKRSSIYLRVTSLLKTIVFIVLIVIGLIIMVFGKSIISTLQDEAGIFKEYNLITQIITYIIFMIITFLIFLCVYKFMPGHKVTFRNQILGAIFASVTLNIISFIFSIYLDIFKGFSITYGSLTAFMLIMMWTYACFYAIFLGAEINKFVDTRNKQKI